DELMEARAAALEAQWSGEGPSPAAVCACGAAYHEDIRQVVAASAEWYCQQVPVGERRQAEAVQCEILRDLFPPFRPVSLHPSWRTPGVVALVRAIDRERAFGRMPELATALAVAGCTSAELLGHLRGAGPHVRGCWAIDLILQKA